MLKSCVEQGYNLIHGKAEREKKPLWGFSKIMYKKMLPRKENKPKNLFTKKKGDKVKHHH